MQLLFKVKYNIYIVGTEKGKGVGGLGKNYLYIVKGDEESEEAIRVLNESNVKYEIIVVDDDDGNGRFMWRDLGTTEIPSLQFSRRVYAGLEAIKKFVRL